MIRKMLDHRLCVGMSTNHGMNPQLIRLEPISRYQHFGQRFLGLTKPSLFSKLPMHLRLLHRVCISKDTKFAESLAVSGSANARVCSRFGLELWEDIFAKLQLHLDGSKVRCLRWREIGPSHDDHHLVCLRILDDNPRRQKSNWGWGIDWQWVIWKTHNPLR